MKLLFENWRRFLTEQNTDNLALYIDDDGEQSWMTLYSPEIMREYRGIDSPQHLVRVGAVIAMIVSERIPTRRGKCYEAFQIIRAASNSKYRGQGYGKFLYEIMAAYVGDAPITGDRYGTSKTAQKVYSKLPAQSKDFDNIDDPQTPPEEDDCRMDPTGGTVNKAYWVDLGIKSQRMEQLSTMKNNHESFMNTVQDEFGYNVESFKRLLARASGDLFGTEYTSGIATGF